MANSKRSKPGGPNTPSVPADERGSKLSIPLAIRESSRRLKKRPRRRSRRLISSRSPTVNRVHQPRFSRMVNRVHPKAEERLGRAVTRHPQPTDGPGWPGQPPGGFKEP